MMFYFLIIISISLDIFLLSLVYSFQNIKISFKMIIFINFISAFSIFIGIVIKECIGNYINSYFLNLIGFFILLFLGLFKIFNFVIKKFINKLSNNKFNSFIKICSDSSLADSDKSYSLSFKEAIPLSLSLALDNLTFGLTLDFSFVYFVIFIFVNYFIVFYLGSIIGKKIPSFKNDASWINGVLFIILAFMRLKK